MPTPTETNPSYNELPVAYVEHLQPYLEAGSAVATTMVSHHWHALFTHDISWRHRIIKDFNIPEALLSKEDINALATDQPYKNLYALLIKWFSESKNDDTYQMYYRYSQHPINLPTLIACCLNNADYTCAMTPLSETEHWLEICLMLDLDQSLIGLAKRCSHSEKTNLLERAIFNGALKITRYILTHLDEFHLPALSQICEYIPIANMIVLSSNPKLQQFLMNKKESGLDHPSIEQLRGEKISIANLNLALNQKNLERVAQLLEAEVSPDEITLKYAIGSRNFRLIRRLINHFKIKLTVKHLEAAAHAGCLTIFNYLLMEDNTLIPNQKTLDNAARSGNVELVDFLLSGFKDLKLTTDTAIEAILSNNLEMLRYIRQNNPALAIEVVFLTWHFNQLKSNYIIALLNSEFNTALTVNLNFLRLAISHNHLELVRYVITERNIEPDLECIRGAASLGKHEILTYLLNRNLNFIPQPQLIWDDATNNVHISALILQPRFRHSIESLSNALASLNEEIRPNKLLRCQIHVKYAYTHLQDEELIEFSQHLGLALSLHLSHGLDLIFDACKTPAAYQLTTNHALVLMQEVKALFENTNYVQNYLLIERRQALQQLQDAKLTLPEAQQKLVETMIKLLKSHCRYQPITAVNGTVPPCQPPR